METGPALKLAMELYVVPSRVRAAQSGPLPAGLHQVLLLAADDELAKRETLDALDRSPDFIREACLFFVEQVLLSPGADDYRVLGTRSDAPAVELRRNMALLLRAFHPDHNPKGEHSVYAARVLSAWESLKSPDGRRAYDAELANRQSSHKSGGRPPRRVLSGRDPVRHLRHGDLDSLAEPSPGVLQRLARLFLGERR